LPALCDCAAENPFSIVPLFMGLSH
jgi:hypothetical protein